MRLTTQTSRQMRFQQSHPWHTRIPSSGESPIFGSHGQAEESWHYAKNSNIKQINKREREREREMSRKILITWDSFRTILGWQMSGEEREGETLLEEGQITWHDLGQRGSRDRGQGACRRARGSPPPSPLISQFPLPTGFLVQPWKPFFSPCANIQINLTLVNWYTTARVNHRHRNIVPTRIFFQIERRPDKIHKSTTRIFLRVWFL